MGTGGSSMTGLLLLLLYALSANVNSESCLNSTFVCEGNSTENCDGELKVVDMFSPELKVLPRELRTIFRSPNHTVPVKVTPSSVITVQLLVPDSNIVSLHIFVDYIKEILLVFLGVDGIPIHNGTHTWKSKRKPGSDIAVMSLEKKWTSNMVKMYLKPFPNPGYNTRMFIKAITLKGCYQLDPLVCPLDYKSVEYRYTGYGSKKFKATIDDIMDGSAILEGSNMNVTLGINELVAITRSNPSDSFILKSIRVFAANITTLAMTFVDVKNNTIGEGGINWPFLLFTWSSGESCSTSDLSCREKWS